MNVLRRSYEALIPNGTMLDLQVIRPHPRVETVDGRLLCEADGTALFESADAARDAVDLFIEECLLAEEAVDDHDVMHHYSTGAQLVEDWEPKKRTLPIEMLPLLRTIDGECVVRERCRLRLLRRVNLPVTPPSVLWPGHNFCQNFCPSQPT